MLQFEIWQLAVSQLAVQEFCKFFCARKTCRILVQVFFLCKSCRFLLFYFILLQMGEPLNERNIHACGPSRPPATYSRGSALPGETRKLVNQTSKKLPVR